MIPAARRSCPFIGTISRPERFMRYCAKPASAGPNFSIFSDLEEHAEVLVEQDVGVEHDRAPPHLPRAVHLAQQILAATGEELMIRLQMRAAHQKRGLGLYLAILRRRRIEIADRAASLAAPLPLVRVTPAVEAGDHVHSLVHDPKEQRVWK